MLDTFAVRVSSGPSVMACVGKKIFAILDL